MSKLKKRLLSLFVTMLMFTSLMSLTASATQMSNSVETAITIKSGVVVTIPDDVMDDVISISADEAEKIAELFVQDATSFENVKWDEDTEVEKIVAMYDQTTEHNATAYTIELTEGYVVVSAYLDSVSLIPEWSDSAEPVYEALNLSDCDQILYLGTYKYYKDSGNDSVEDINGNSIERESLVNDIEETRSIDNIPTATLQSVAIAYKDQKASESSESNLTEAITDPITDADDNYDGPFVCNDYVNFWENYATFKRTSDFSGYNNHCGPTAITNLILTYGNRYLNYISHLSSSSIFSNVASIGVDNGYFSSANGTIRSTAGNYIRDSFSSYSVTANVSGRYNATYSNIKTQLSNNALLYVSLYDHELYGDHAVMCFSYTRLISQTTGYYKTYMKVSDGWYSSARYIDLATATTARFWSVTF